MHCSEDDKCKYLVHVLAQTILGDIDKTPLVYITDQIYVTTCKHNYLK